MALTNCILALLHSPAILQKAHAELDTVIGRGRVPCYEDKEKLPYIQAMARETLRWRPPAPLGMYLTATVNIISHCFQLCRMLPLRYVSNCNLGCEGQAHGLSARMTGMKGISFQKGPLSSGIPGTLSSGVLISESLIFIAILLLFRAMNR